MPAEPTDDGFHSLLTEPVFRPPHDRLKLWLTAIGLVFAFFVVNVLVNWFIRTKLWEATGWDLDEREISLVALIILAAAVVSSRKLYRIMRSRSHRF
jgi:hypothetical protein